MTRRPAGAAVLLIALAAACTATPDVSRTASEDIGRSVATSDGPAASTAGSDDPAGVPRAPVRPPVATGLPDVDQVDPAIVQGTLDNGLRYLIRENDNPGRRVEMRLAIDAGSGRQQPDQGGGAHFLEHMLFNGTERFPENELVAVLRSFGTAFGADVNATTGYDETVYQLTMPTDDPQIVTTGLEVLHQWLTAATIDQQQVEAERGIVLDEWRVAVESADGRIGQEVQRFFLDDTPYAGRTPIGTRDEILATDAAPLRRFYDDWYRPDRASVIVVGDVDAGEIEAQIIDLFAPATPRADPPDGGDLVVTPAAGARARVVDDPDLTEGFAFVNLPRALDRSRTTEEREQRRILDELAFDIIGTRLADDSRRGRAAFDDARVDSSGFVRLLDAPEIVVTADGDALVDATQAVLDEYERVRRFGVDAAEVERAVGARRRAARDDFERRFSRQDASFADEYVRHALTAEPIPTGERWFEFVDEVLARADPETITSVFLDRFEATGPHVFVAVPSDEADAVPGASDFVELAESLPERELTARPAETVVGAELLAPPEPVDEIAATSLADGSRVRFIAPEVLTFPNGVQVSFNVTPIVEGVVVLEGRSPGGLAALADEDVADGIAAAVVVDRSGAGPFDAVDLDAFLSDKTIELDARLDVFTEGFVGLAATSDLETALQLVHLRMTAPQIDAIALDQFIDDERALAEDPTIDVGYAEFTTLTEARYNDPRWHALDVDDLASIDAADAERVLADRFGDASDWAFSFSGDFDVAEAVELARTYLGSLPGGVQQDPADFAEPPPPPGIVVETARAGKGAQARVSFLFAGPATPDRRDDIVARLVQHIVTARLSDTIREELGESYSPFGLVRLSGGSAPFAELYLTITTGPDLVESVSGAVRAELDALRADGPTDAEFAAARQTVRNQLGLFSNEQINDEVLRVLTDPGGHASFAEFLAQNDLVDLIRPEDVRDAIARWAPADRFIEVRVTPR